MKIALVGFRLNKGGAERVMAILSTFFVNRGIEVHNIIVMDDVAYPYAGTLLNLGKLKNKTNGSFNKLKRMLVLKRYLNQQKFDYIIDFRFRIKPIQEYLIAKYIYNARTIYTVHSSYLNSYFPKSKTLGKIIYGNSFKVISITKAMQSMIEKKYDLKNVMTIYNPIDIEHVREKADESIAFNFDYIIAVGQFDTNVKQFDKLIVSYSNSILPKENIKLLILGKGNMKDKLLDIAEQNGVASMVELLGFKNNPYKYIKRARFFVLSSSHEGMPMVVLESLACETPVLSFDCMTGPREIIKNEENGLLIENQDFEKLTMGMNRFVTDNDLYLKTKKNALASIGKFSIDTIGLEWIDLLK